MLASEAAQALLNAFVAELEAVPGFQMPERRYVAPGQIAVWDSEQLVVNLQELPRGQPEQPTNAAGWPIPTVLNARFALQIVRSVPSLENEGISESMVPDETELNTAGVQFVNDAQQLSLAGLAVQAAWATNNIAGPGQFALGPCMPLGPEGGFAANQLLVTVALS